MAYTNCVSYGQVTVKPLIKSLSIAISNFRGGHGDFWHNMLGRDIEHSWAFYFITVLSGEHCIYILVLHDSSLKVKAVCSIGYCWPQFIIQDSHNENDNTLLLEGCKQSWRRNRRYMQDK